jgi:hypothetical protein
MLKKLILVLSVAIVAFNPSIAQNIQSAHQLTPSCILTTDGKVIVNAGGHYTTSVSEQVFLRDSLHGSVFDTVSSAFNNTNKVYYTYDNGGLLTESAAKTLDKNGQSWSNSQQVIYTYSGFYLVEETNKSWDKTHSEWANFIDYKYSYETDNTLSSIFNLPWDSDSSEWQYSTKDLISYDPNKSVTSISNQKWNKNLNSWENYLRINFTYSGGYISEKLYQAWNKQNQLWVDYQKETFSYTNNNKTEVVTQTKSAGTDWENYSRITFAYDNTLLNTSTEYFWYGEWKENRKFNYTYSSTVETVVLQQWAAHLGSFRNQSQTESYFSQREVFGIGETPATIFAVNNPLSKHNAFQIAGLKSNTNYQMKIVAINGAIVLSMPVSAGQSIVLGNRVPNGIYMLGLTSAGMKAVNQKILVTD